MATEQLSLFDFEKLDNSSALSAPTTGIPQSVPPLTKANWTLSQPVDFSNLLEDLSIFMSWEDPGPTIDFLLEKYPQESRLLANLLEQQETGSLEEFLKAFLDLYPDWPLWETASLVTALAKAEYLELYILGAPFPWEEWTNWTKTKSVAGAHFALKDEGTIPHLEEALKLGQELFPQCKAEGALDLHLFLGEVLSQLQKEGGDFLKKINAFPKVDSQFVSKHRCISSVLSKMGLSQRITAFISHGEDLRQFQVLLEQGRDFIENGWECWTKIQAIQEDSPKQGVLWGDATTFSRISKQVESLANRDTLPSSTILLQLLEDWTQAHANLLEELSHNVLGKLQDLYLQLKQQLEEKNAEARLRNQILKVIHDGMVLLEKPHHAHYPKRLLEWEKFIFKIEVHIEEASEILEELNTSKRS